MGQTGSPVTRSNTYKNAFLFVIMTAWTRLPSTVKSPSTGAPMLSNSQIPWWIIWKCQARLPVLASRARRLFVKRLSPGRKPPHMEPLFAERGTYT